tara:strand:- start:484 stop:780 length:297 start_codon:yes stop_codon:yes gene_type:complete
MRIIIKESELIYLIQKTLSEYTQPEYTEEEWELEEEEYELDEQDDGGGTGTSSAGEGVGTAGMPKWESGIGRGVANQLAVTRWQDLYTPARGSANTLW